MLSRLKNIIAKIKEFNKLPPPESRSGQLYAVTALFEKPDQIIKAANEVAGKGYKDFDVMTPYPVNGMDDAMKLSSTKIGFVAFALGITGTMLALLMIGWMSGIDYKNVIGGKPFFAIPPSIPITFEVTVLLASITTVLGMLILFNKLPWISNPLQDSDYMRRVSSDMFGIIIEAKDKKFNEREVRSLFQGLGSNIIEPVYYPVVDIDKPKTPIFSPKFMTTLAVTALLTAAASYLTLNYLLYDVEPFNWMWKQPKVLPQSTSSFFSDGWSMRKPVEGTVARGFIPYEYKGIPDSLIKVFYVNPLPVSREIIEKGKKRFETYCSPCHGYYAKGDSRLKGQFPAPPTLHSDKVRNWSDGNIYHMITNGRNAMPSYEKQISRDDRWAIIHYIRVLQRSQNAKDQDLEGK